MNVLGRSLFATLLLLGATQAWAQTPPAAGATPAPAATTPAPGADSAAKIEELNKKLGDLNDRLAIVEKDKAIETEKREAAEREVGASSALIKCIEEKPAFRVMCYLAIVKSWRDTKAGEIAFERVVKAVEPLTLPRSAPIDFADPPALTPAPGNATTQSCPQCPCGCSSQSMQNLPEPQLKSWSPRPNNKRRPCRG